MHINNRIVGAMNEGPASRYTEHEVPLSGLSLLSEAMVKDLDQEHEAVVRQRILNGAYDALEMVDLVARRILESGDLESDDLE